MENQLKIIWQPIAEGTESIESWWSRNCNFIQSITHVDTEEEVMIWTASYYRYGMYLHNDGYSKQSLEYVDKALDILEKKKGKLYEAQYKDSLEAIMEGKTSVLYKLEQYWEAYKLMSRLHSMKPQKDDYRIGMKNLFSASISKIVNPIYVILACIWGVMLLEQYVFHTEFIPSIVWTITWACWIVLLVIQFVIPTILFKIRK